MLGIDSVYCQCADVRLELKYVGEVEKEVGRISLRDINVQARLRQVRLE